MLFRGITIQVLIARIIVLMTAIPVHEFAHAYVADKMGDPTARYSRRISLNPLDHIDQLGALMILLLGVGFARPVPVNSLQFTNRKKGIILTSLAGPASNVLLAAVCLALVKLTILLFGMTGFTPLMGLLQVLSAMVSINLSLAVFNLLPMPPLDGWHAITPLLPYQLYWKIQPYENQIVWVVLFLAFIGVLNPILSLFTGILYRLIDAATFFLG